MNKTKKTKQEKGITLIALIITIVVLLILAVVAIRAVQGDGILSYAQNARDDYQKAQDEEESMLQNYIDKLKVNSSNNNDSSEEETESAPGLYKTDGTFVSWEQLTSMEYCTLTNNCCIPEQAILTVDENGVLTSAYDTNICCFENLSAAHLNGKLVLEDSVKIIGWPGFTGCSNLTSVIIPNGVTTIKGDAFGSNPFGASCSSLTSIKIPESVTSINYSAFSGCINLSSVVVDENNPVYDSRDNCNAIIETATDTIIIGLKNTTFPESVKNIGFCAFQGCEGLTSIVIPDYITTIGQSAFSSCNNLITVTIGSGISRIGDSAFRSCKNLTTINMSTNITNIDMEAFYYCEKLNIINYSGTQEEWNNIEFGPFWNGSNVKITVHCTDGDIIIDPDV